VNLKYLCANHREWLTSNTKRAEQAWIDWTERGATLCEEGSYEQAIPYLGCAFELASYLLAESTPAYSVAATRFTDCARQLIEAYRHRGDEGLGNYILVGASSRLARELSDRRRYQLTADCIRTLYMTESSIPEQWRGQVAATTARVH